LIHRWGIRARVTLVAFIPMLVLAGLMTATHTTLRLGELDNALRARAQAYVRQTAVASEYPLFIGDHIALQQLLDSLLLEEDMAALALIAPDRSLIARAGSFEHTTPPQAAVAGTTRTARTNSSPPSSSRCPWNASTSAAPSCCGSPPAGC